MRALAWLTIAGIATLSLGLAGPFTTFFDVARKSPEPVLSALVLFPSLVAIPFGFILTVFASVEGLRVLRTTGVQKRFALTGVISLGVGVSVLGLVGMLALLRACDSA
ncbi:MAG: hypothetical protein IT357_16175 [Gemmatimonadaceae bacterium]|nr:hypothetical protein [Gemmatimonadaceae bacterium]